MPRGGRPSAIVNFWNMETMAGAWGVHAVGLVGLEVSASERCQGVATYLLGESFRQLHAQGIALAEVHVAEDNLPAHLFRRLGFERGRPLGSLPQGLTQACDVVDQPLLVSGIPLVQLHGEWFRAEPRANDCKWFSKTCSRSGEVSSRK